MSIIIHQCSCFNISANEKVYYIQPWSSHKTLELIHNFGESNITQINILGG